MTINRTRNENIRPQYIASSIQKRDWQMVDLVGKGRREGRGAGFVQARTRNDWRGSQLDAGRKRRKGGRGRRPSLKLLVPDNVVAEVKE